MKGTPTYSRIITPEEYNRIISDEHLYISDSDKKIIKFVEEERDAKGAREVVEIGCGPARLLQKLQKIEKIDLTGVDHDSDFIDYARQKITNKNTELVLADIKNYTHKKKVDIFISQGMHHHIPKGKETREYLKNISKQLVKGGVYIVGDEFLPEYSDEHERKIKATVWYSHIISSAKKGGFEYLAREETKTLLDDLYEGDPNPKVKDDSQINLVLKAVDKINETALSGDIRAAEKKAIKLLEDIYRKTPVYKGDDVTVVLSRGDFKICETVFAKEVSEAGLSIEKKERVGPIVDIGAMVIYVLRLDDRV